VTTTPVGAAPAGPNVGEEPSSVSVPPLTPNPLIAFEAVSTTHSVEPSGESRASSGPVRDRVHRRVPEQGQRAVRGDRGLFRGLQARSPHVGIHYSR
jgi:hypothetical protein